MLANPYTPGVPRPAHLSGRGSELASIDEQGARVRAFGTAGPLLAIHGPRGTGKTSLLRRAQVEAAEAGMVTLWVTGSRHTQMLETLAEETAAGMQRSGLGEVAKGLLGRIQQLQVELGVPGAKVSAQIAGSADAPPPRRIGTLLRETAVQAREHGHHGVMLFLDEFHEASVEDRSAVLVALQDFAGDALTTTPLAAVATGLPSLPGAITEAATFGERSSFVELKGLTPAAVAEALRVPAAHFEVTWDDDAITQAVDLAGTYPHKVQLVGEAAWRHARPTAESTITSGDVAGSAEAVENAMQDLHRARWAHATPQQRRFLTAIAADGADSAARRDIATYVGTTPQALSRPRDELIRSGVITADGHGRVKFTMPGFADFVRQQPQPDAATTRRGGQDRTSGLGR